MKKVLALVVLLMFVVGSRADVREPFPMTRFQSVDVFEDPQAPEPCHAKSAEECFQQANALCNDPAKPGVFNIQHVNYTLDMINPTRFVPFGCTIACKGMKKTRVCSAGSLPNSCSVPSLDPCNKCYVGSSVPGFNPSACEGCDQLCIYDHDKQCYSCIGNCSHLHTCQ